MTRRLVRILWATSLAVLLLGRAAPALAQNGTLSGRVIDVDGKPVDLAQITIDLAGTPPRQLKAVTDKNGEWYKSGVPPGTYTISAMKEWIDRSDKSQSAKTVTITGKAENVVVKPGEKVRAPEIGALTEAARAAGRTAPVKSTMSSADAEAANKRAAEMEALLKTANAAAAEGRHEEAIAQYTAFADKLAEKGDKCAACYVKIGESQLALKAVDKAEAAFLKAIELDANLAAPYLQLATIYNGQRKFEEAKTMTDKATALMGAGGGGGDATSAYNRGIINWNAGQYEDAKGDFAKAVQLDPKMANAQYYLGMAIFNLASTGKAVMADAKAPFQEYLKLAPTGEYAEVAKAILATIK